MLSPSTKNDIRSSYENLRAQLQNFIPRKAQNFLVAELAKTLAGEYNPKRRIMVAEAGTGIGKSMAYLLGSIPYALNNNKKVVVSTATVALQEQLIEKDLPLFRRVVTREFSFVLAKGRQRYCCGQKLAAFANEEGHGQQALFEHKPKKAEIALMNDLHSAYAKGKWSGDRDAWPKPIPDTIWQSIVSDKHTCHSGLTAHRGCPFAKARENLDKADVIVANHSLLMADLELGGGVILPEPEQTLYMIDEAHHLPIVARDFSAASASLLGAASWLEKLNQSASKLANAGDIKRSSRFLDSLQTAIQDLIPSLRSARDMLSDMPLNNDGVYRFEDGELPEALFNLSKEIQKAAKKANQSLAKLHDLISERVKDGEIAARLADPIQAESAFFLQRLENLEKVWTLMAQPNANKGAPLARWIQRDAERETDLVVHVSPLEIGWRLDQLLWSRAAGVSLMSATLRALNQFSYFCRQVGLEENDGTRFLALPSPFHYEENAQLVVPNVPFEPQQEQFTAMLPDILLEYLEGQTASLVLFSSYWQMNQVAEKLRLQIKKNGWHLHVQGEASRTATLDEHRKCCEQGKVSILFGTGSFSEGVDLPGNQLTNLIITKIPFAVPTSPVEEAHAEYIERKGGNPFMQISVPEASKKLIQSAGRLLRKEQDSGRVVLLDRRVINRRYGKALLDSLPPFKRVIEYT
ncbi:ATP-dependent DNA helicase DinG [Enterovibrio norvegicus]|uniref:ATP-dependent DNA helicase DinG n=1 Tax=Enterovibrio norvegicus TaxID=188144 RepID=UPI000C867C44|nr:ATP-dependent DNA helicase DinG [Enterovibrio norvegicus]PMI33054.1 ATP-dependent DNA helicase DinG [Enterovibrio norvegicus]TKF08910.1 ATP-dependent DNA helicase DinG [Enterovibrio norvegicus]TKF34501.1 ATP-dependent DNA helicase DinG [Enterovibrio norvegicus]